MSAQKPKVLVGMSGGVDSSLSAALLLEQGYEVIGAFMKNWSGTVLGPSCADPEKVGEEFAECDWRDERRDAMRVASQLGIPILTLDFEKEYRELVVEYMFREFQAGRTPNPDVMCNKFVKFDLFVREADRLGCQFVATGHYARISPLPSSPCEGEVACTDSKRVTPSFQEGVGGSAFRILKGLDDNKDQTYFLWAIPPAVLSRVLFPVGHLPKPEVRKMAAERGISTAEKPDSTGICFVGEVDLKKFLQARIKDKPGNIVTTEGKVVGQHDGITFYTIGQRHGLNVGGGIPYYVVGKNIEKDELIVSNAFHPALFRAELSAIQANWFRVPNASLPLTKGKLEGVREFRCTARIRYRQPVAPCSVEFLPLSKGELEGVAFGRVLVRFDEPQRAVTPGQSIVFYDGEEMLGGAIIE